MVFLQLAGTTKDGCVSRYKDRRERATGGNRCKCLALPEAEHCCISILPPSAAPKRYYHDSLHKSALEGGCPGPHPLPPSVTLFFFFPSAHSAVDCAWEEPLCTHCRAHDPSHHSACDYYHSCTPGVLSQDSERQAAKSLVPT